MNVNDGTDAHAADGDLESWMREWRARIERGLEETLPPASTRPAVVHEAMRYASLNGGKRLRAILALSMCDCLGGDPEDAFLPALALEIFHASTLVHDDLPCMDDDELRRGKPATHIRFGEANALLAGNALLTLALEWMARVPPPPPHPAGALVTELAQAGGSRGVIGGQIEDLLAEGESPAEDRLRYIHTEKTARLIACACRVGGICGGASREQVERAGTYGVHLGLAFQILDDILDSTRTTEELGKPAKSDEAANKLTAVTLWGVEKSRREAGRQTERALEALDALARPCDRLRELTGWLLDRSM